MATDDNLNPDGSPGQPTGQEASGAPLPSGRFGNPTPGGAMPVIGEPADGRSGPYPVAMPPQIHNYILVPPKSVGLAIILSFLFGPLGMLYVTVNGAVVMFLVNLVIGLMTFGFGLFLTWPICVVWAVVAANSHNAQLTHGVTRIVGPT